MIIRHNDLGSPGQCTLLHFDCVTSGVNPATYFDFQNSSGIIYVKYLIFSRINGDDLIIEICLLLILSYDPNVNRY